MDEKQRRDYGSGSISQRKDGTWTARMVIGVNEKGKPVASRYIDRMFRKIAIAAGLEEDKIYGLHSLRHTFASRLFANGEDVKTVSELLGHSDITIREQMNQ